MLARLKKNAFLRGAWFRWQECRQPYPWRPYFNRRRILFIHVPKCGGTTVLSALADGGRIWRDHATAEDFYKANREKFNTYERFAVVRDPLERAYSTYRYLLAGGNRIEDVPLHEKLMGAGGTFDAFVATFLQGEQFHAHRLFWPQLSFLTVHGRLAIPRLVPLASLDDYLADLAQRKKLAQPLRLNASDGPALDSDTRSRFSPVIRSIYDCDYTLLENLQGRSE